jgi:hypothetical protein
MQVQEGAVHKGFISEGGHIQWARPGEGLGCRGGIEQVVSSNFCAMLLEINP